MTFNLETELRQYVETALWSSVAEAADGDGEPMDANYSAEDISLESLASMRADLQSFLQGPGVHEDASDEDVDQWEAALECWLQVLGEGQLGHDFWLTRNGHGAGFWDRFSGQQDGARYGELLTSAAKAYGSSDLYIGDDGRVYVS